MAIPGRDQITPKRRVANAKNLIKKPVNPESLWIPPLLANYFSPFTVQQKCRLLSRNPRPASQSALSSTVLSNRSRSQTFSANGIYSARLFFTMVCCSDL
jgi:hypothetical protein